MKKNVEKYLYIISPILIVVSLAFFYIKNKFETVSIVTMAAGVVIGGVFLLRFWDEITKKFTKRRLRYGINNTVVVIFAVAIVVVIYLVTMNHSKRFDLTEVKRFSLSDQTVKVLERLKGPVKAYAFYSKQMDKTSIIELFNEYKYLYKDFDFQIVDPDLNPGLSKEFGVEEYGDIYIEYEGKREKVKTNDEEGITNALVKLSQIEVKKIYFVKGHGERSIEDYSNEGYDNIKAAIEAENYKVEDILLLEQKKVPDDCSVLIVAGPKTDYQEYEIGLLEDYLKKGGNLFFLLDPDEEGNSFPNLTKFLDKYGFILRNDVIIDPLAKVFSGDYFMPVVSNYTYNPVTKDFRIVTFLRYARSVFVKDNPGENISTREVARTSDASWGEVDFQKARKLGKVKYDEGKDIKGPVTVVAYSRITLPEKKEEGESKSEAYIFVIGDSDFITNSMYQTQGNKDLFLNAVNFLAGRTEMITIRPKQQESVYLTLSFRQGRIAFMILLVVVPLLIILAGVYINIRRRLSL